MNKLIQPTKEERGDRKFWELFARLGTFYAHYAVAAAATVPVVFFDWMVSDKCLETSDPIDPSDKLPDLEEYANKTLSEKDREYLLGVRTEAIRGAAFSNAAAHVNGFDRSQLALMIPHAGP